MRAIHNTLLTLEMLGRIQPAGVSELARALDLPKSTVQRSLKALHQAGWIETISGERGAWSLSLTALIAVGRGDYATRNLRMAAIPVMEELRRKTKESIFLAAHHNHHIALIERLDGINPINHAWPLWRGGPMHATSLGKAILAELPDGEQTAYLAQPLAKVTPHTEIEPAALRAEFATIRANGFATTFRTNWINENGVGCAIRDVRGVPVGAISLSGPADRVSEADCVQLGPLVMDAARRIGMGLAPR